MVTIVMTGDAHLNEPVNGVEQALFRPHWKAAAFPAFLIDTAIWYFSGGSDRSIAGRGSANPKPEAALACLSQP